MKNVFQRPQKECRKHECNNPIVAKMPRLSKIKSKASPPGFQDLGFTF